MRRILFISGVMAILVVGMSSCAASRKDCQGIKKTRLANGIYI